MSLKVNVLVSWLAHAVTLVIGFFLMPYILHAVGDNTYGTWLFLNSIAGQTSLLYLGFGDAISRFTARHFARRHWVQLNRTFSCVTSVYCGSALIALSIGCLLAYLAPALHSWPGQSLREVRLAILLLGLNASISIAGSAFGGVLMGIQRFDVERGIIIVITLLRLALTLLFVKAQYGLLTLASIFLAVTVIENLLTCAMAFRHVPHLQFRFRHLRRDTYRECFGFSLFSFLSLIAEHLIYMVDTIVIGFLLGPVAVVPYYIASRLCDMIRIPVLQIGHVMLPRAGQLHTQQEFQRLRKLVCQGMGVAFLLACAALCGAACFADLMIQVWIGGGYAQSYWILLILLFGQVVALPTHLLRHVLTGTGYVRLPALLFAAEAAVNLILSLILIRWWGVVGVALGTLIPLLLMETGLLLPVGLKRLQLRWQDLLRFGIVPQFIPLSLILVYSLLVRMLPLSATWPCVIGIATGALGVLAVGVQLSRWNNRLRTDRQNPHPKLAKGALT